MSSRMRTASDVAGVRANRAAAHSQPHVVIIGAGFAGLNAAKTLARDSRARVTLIDRRNHHLFQPLLYQVSMAELTPSDVAAPIRSFFRGRPNVEVLLADVTGIDVEKKCVVTNAGGINYDYLIVAPGSQHSYYGHDEWEPFAPGLKTLGQATEIRRRVLLAFENAECCASLEQRDEFLTFVLIGGGPTGVELAGAIAELARFTLARDYKRIDPGQARVILLEGGKSILANFDSRLTTRAVEDLEALGVEVRLNSMVSEIKGTGVKVGADWIRARTVLWAAGVVPSSLGTQLGAPMDDIGRVIVNPDLSIQRHRNVFVAGDLARAEQDGEPLPGVAGVALQQGKFLGKLIRRELSGKSRKPFRYRDRGAMATIGHNRAIAQIGRVRIKGRLAWVAWVFVHIYYLSGFRNRIFVMLQWAWAYFTQRRSSRIIIDKEWQFYPGSHGTRGDRDSAGSDRS